MGDAAVIDLKEDDLLIPQYVDLRNRYAQQLLTKPVTVAETKAWLLREVVEVKCLIENDALVGAAILYLNKGGEVALFAKEPKKRVGSELLRVVEKVAAEKKLGSLWAWVLATNVAAQRVFLKNGYRFEKECSREYNGEVLTGFIYKKTISVTRVRGEHE